MAPTKKSTTAKKRKAEKLPGSTPVTVTLADLNRVTRAKRPKPIKYEAEIGYKGKYESGEPG